MKNNVKANFIYNIVYQFLTIIIPLITAPYVARVLGPTNSGIHSYTYSISYYFVVFAMLGINNYGNRVIAKCRDDKELLNKTFSSLFYAHIIISVLSLFLFFMFSLNFSSKYQFYFMLQSLYVFGSVIDINWYFYGLEEFRITVPRNIIIKILTTISIFTFVKSESDLPIYVFILGFSSFISQLLLYLFLHKTNVHFVKVSKKEIFNHFKPLFILFLPTFAMNLYKSMDKIMLEYMINVKSVGLYEYAERIMTLPTLFILSLGTVMLPKISNLLSKGANDKVRTYIEKSIEFVLFLSLGMCFGLISISNEFIPIFLGNKYIDSINLLRILSISIPFVAMSNVIQTQYLIPREKDREYIEALLIGVFINLLLNIFLIGKIGAIGACIATVFTELFVMIYQFLKTKNYFNLIKCTRLFGLYFTKGLLMFIVIQMVDLLHCSDFITLFLKLFLGMIVYCLLNYKYIKSFIPQKFLQKGQYKHYD